MKIIFSMLTLAMLVGCNGWDNTTGLPKLPFPNAPKQELTVYRHSTTRLDNRRADNILHKASYILQKDDGPDDVACHVRLVREGKVTEFSDGDGVISDKDEFDEMMALPGKVKLVKAIKWCKGYKTARGCAPGGDGSLAVIPLRLELAAIVWAHEYGHVKARSHCNRDKGCHVNCNVDNALMHQCPGTNSKRINSAECNAFQR